MAAAVDQDCLKEYFSQDKKGLFERLNGAEGASANRSDELKATDLVTIENFNGAIVDILNGNNNRPAGGEVKISGLQITTADDKVILDLETVRNLFGDNPVGVSKLIDNRSAIAWLQYFLARACYCAGNIIEELQDTFCGIENASQIMNDLEYARVAKRMIDDDTQRCDELYRGILACLQNTLDVNYFELNGTTISVAGCGANEMKLDLSLYMPCMLPVILNIFFMYGGAHKLKNCAGGVGEFNNVTETNLIKMLACWLKPLGAEYLPPVADEEARIPAAEEEPRPAAEEPADE